MSLVPNFLPRQQQWYSVCMLEIHMTVSLCATLLSNMAYLIYQEYTPITFDIIISCEGVCADDRKPHYLFKLLRPRLGFTAISPCSTKYFQKARFIFWPPPRFNSTTTQAGFLNKTHCFKTFQSIDVWCDYFMKPTVLYLLTLISHSQTIINFFSPHFEFKNIWTAWWLRI